MANKVKMLTMLQEMKSLALITNRRPAPRPSVLYLMKLRAQASESGSAKRRLAISVQTNGKSNDPLPVKINHVKSGARYSRVLAR